MGETRADDLPGWLRHFQTVWDDGQAGHPCEGRNARGVRRKRDGIEDGLLCEMDRRDEIPRVDETADSRKARGRAPRGGDLDGLIDPCADGMACRCSKAFPALDETVFRPAQDG